MFDVTIHHDNDAIAQNAQSERDSMFSAPSPCNAPHTGSGGLTKP